MSEGSIVLNYCVLGTAASSVMAYNVELLASFEKEKKGLERRISELIAITEARKTEIEKYRFEIKNLNETLRNTECGESVTLMKVRFCCISFCIISI